MKHVFITQRLPSTAVWQQAFADAKVQAGAAGLAVDIDILWLHLGSQEIASCLATLPRPLNTKLVVLSDIPNDDEGLAALDAGAVGYCNASAAVDVLVQVADVVRQGGLWVGPSLLNRLLRHTTQNQARPRQNWAQCLTPREAEIARAASRGQSNREIATELGITERTVKAHLTVVFDKLQLRDRLQLSLHVHGLGPEQ